MASPFVYLLSHCRPHSPRTVRIKTDWRHPGSVNEQLLLIPANPNLRRFDRLELGTDVLQLRYLANGDAVVVHRLEESRGNRRNEPSGPMAKRGPGELDVCAIRPDDDVVLIRGVGWSRRRAKGVGKVSAKIECLANRPGLHAAGTGGEPGGENDRPFSH